MAAPNGQGPTSARGTGMRSHAAPRPSRFAADADGGPPARPEFDAAVTPVSPATLPWPCEPPVGSRAGRARIPTQMQSRCASGPGKWQWPASDSICQNVAQRPSALLQHLFMLRHSWFWEAMACHLCTWQLRQAVSSLYPKHDQL